MSLEERFGEAKQEMDRAKKEMDRLGGLLNKKASLKLQFQALMRPTDSQFRRENNIKINDFDSLRLNDLILAAVYKLYSHPVDYVLDSSLRYQVENVALDYMTKARDRTLTEAEYNSLANPATEPFIGRYIQRVYDIGRKDDEEAQKIIDDEEARWNTQHKKLEPKPETPQKPSLLKRIFGGWGR